MAQGKEGMGAQPQAGQAGGGGQAPGKQEAAGKEAPRQERPEEGRAEGQREGLAMRRGPGIGLRRAGWGPGMEVGPLSLLRRMSEQMGQASHSLGIAQPDQQSGELDGPVLALLGEQIRPRGVFRCHRAPVPFFAFAAVQIFRAAGSKSVPG